MRASRSSALEPEHARVMTGGPGSGRPCRSGLLVDLYQLTMAESYLAEGIAQREATFSLFFRTLPQGWGYALAAGLEDALAYLEGLRFAPDELAYLEETRRFGDGLLARLAELRFTGAVRAMPEGTPVFPNEPLLEVTAPLLEAQIAETMVLNEVHLQTLVASKAARSVDAAGGRLLVDFSLRRTHGGEAGTKVARASYLAGFDATSNVLAGRLYGIPLAGTMAHSYVESFAGELEAFRAFARAYPDDAILLVDTYDTLEGTRRAAVVARELAAAGHRLRGVRLDSGDVVDLSGRARSILDEAGFQDAIVFVSGGLDEREIAGLVEAGAPIGGFGVGSKMGVSADAPFLDMAYKLVEIAGRPVGKLSTGKATLPGAKQVWRLREGGTAARDVVTLDRGEGEGEPLLRKVMRDGRATWSEPLVAVRERARVERDALPRILREVEAAAYEVRIDPALERLRDRVAAEMTG